MSQFAKILFGAVLLVVLLAGGYLLQKGRTIDPMVENGGISASSTLDFNLDLPSAIDQVPQDPGISLNFEPAESAPSLSHPIVKPTSLDSGVFEVARDHIEGIADDISADPFNYDLWVELGNYRNIISDHARAREAWEYASLIRPTQATAFVNLGNLYEQEHGDYVKAEEYYLIALELAPEVSGSYMRLFDLYRFFYKDKQDQAPVILTQGLEQFPDDLEFLVQLARYYVGVNSNQEAKGYYERAIVVAENFGESATVASLENELRALR